jgi:hypothetical protein
MAPMGLVASARVSASAMSGRVFPEGARHIVYDEGQDEEIEGVEGPAQEPASTALR